MGSSSHFRPFLFLLKSLARRPLLLFGVGAVLTATVLWWATATTPERPSAAMELMASVPVTPPVAAKPALRLVERAVRSGETLGKVLADFGLERREANEAVDALRTYVDPRRIRTGEVLLASFGQDQALSAVELKVPGKGRVALAKLEGQWRTTWTPVVREVLPQVISGKLAGSSLEKSIEDAGADGSLAYELADVLQWDLDFSRDLRIGDTFQIAFEETFLDGKYDSVAAITAVRYENRGRTISAYRFGESGSYYDSEGRPLKKMFLRSPLKFSRITSRFSHRRFHPVLHTFRPHYGVDYGAPTGTPVMATANGTVTFAGWDRGGGKTVKLRHSGGYLTAYLHLSRFADGVRPGQSVKQGDVVGFVGSTGLSTAPHLDYRVSLNGTWIDPLSLTTVPARPLNGSELATFEGWRRSLDLSLVTGRPMDPDVLKQRPAIGVASAADVTSARR